MRCEHFEVEGLARLEAGKPDPHVEQCADCKAARATYRRMTDAIADVGKDLRPRDGWEDEVLAKVRAPRRGRWWMGGVGVAVMAAAVAVLVLRGRDRGELVTSIDRVPSGSSVRGDRDVWTSGDHIWSISEGGRAVWIYRGENLARTCDLSTIDPPGCVRHGDGVRAWLKTRVGTYHVVAFQDPPPPQAPATYDQAKAKVSERANWATDQSFEVR